VVIRSLKRSQDASRGSFSCCLKVRTSIQRRATLEIGKNFKQNLEHNTSQSPCILCMVRLYRCLAIPIKENGKSFHLKVLSDMPTIRKHAQVYSNSCRCKFGFASPSSEKDCSQIMFIKHGHSS
jgi:hypothetical protein